MNTIVTSREAILEACRCLVAQQGLSALNMRAVARRCNVALGSLYNYFPSKSALTMAAIESVWLDIFHLEQPCTASQSFLQDVAQIFNRANAGIAAYPNFFTAHSLGFASDDRGEARRMMEQCFSHIANGLGETLARDPAVRSDAFDGAFSPDAFVGLVLSSLLSLLVQHAPSCSVLLEVIRRTLYDPTVRQDGDLSQP